MSKLVSLTRSYHWKLSPLDLMKINENSQTQEPFDMSVYNWNDPPDKKVIAIESESNHNCALFDDGSMKCWGQNTMGQCGVGNTISPRYAGYVDSNGSVWDTSMDCAFSSVTSNDNGLYTIRRSDMSTLQVYCDFSDPDESWTMLYVDFEFEIIAFVFEH